MNIVKKDLSQIYRILNTDDFQIIVTSLTNNSIYLKELKELRDIDYEMVVCINYDNGMGYTIDYWSSKDIVKGGEE